MAFPTTGVLEDGSGANEDPLDTHWDGTHIFINGDTGVLAKISNQLTNQTGGGTDTSEAYDGASGSQTFSPPLEIWSTIPTVSAVTGDEYNLVMMNAVNLNTADGYDVHIVKAAGADTWQIRRRDNVIPTVLGANMTQEISSGDSVGISYISGVLTAYYKSGAGAWTTVGTRSDSTYGGPFYLGIKTVQASPLAWKTVPFGGGSASSAADNSPPIIYGRGAC